MEVKVPDNIKSKDLEVVVKATTLKVKVKGQEPIIDGEWFKKIIPGESVLWTLESDGPKRILQI